MPAQRLSRLFCAATKRLSRRSVLVWTIGFSVLSGLAVYIWPTRYRYETLVQQGTTVILRMDRLNGETAMVYPVFQRMPGDDRTAPVNLPSSELRKLQGQTRIDPTGFLTCDLYNGSDFTLSEIGIFITMTNENGSIAFARCYQLHSNPFGGNTEQASAFTTWLGYELSPGQRWQWDVVSARGRRVRNSPPSWRGDAFDYAEMQMRDDAKSTAK